jgi:cell division protein FtsQ
MAGPERSAVTDPPAATVVQVPEAERRSRERPRRRRRHRAALLALGLVIVLASGAVGASYSPIFRAEHLEVLGVKRVGPDEVLSAARLGPRTNVMHYDEDLVVARILALPWVAAARIDRELPDTLIVTIRERVPVATIELGAEQQLVTRDGAILPGASAVRLPGIRPLSGAPDERSVAGAAVALAAMPRSLVRQVGEVVLVPGGTLLVRLRSGIPVEWGSATEAREKAEALAAILAWIDDTGSRVSAIDVSVPQAPRATP